MVAPTTIVATTAAIVDIVRTDMTGEAIGLLVETGPDPQHPVATTTIDATGLHLRPGGIMMREDLQGTMTIIPGTVMMTANILTTIMTVAEMNLDVMIGDARAGTTTGLPEKIGPERTGPREMLLGMLLEMLPETVPETPPEMPQGMLPEKIGLPGPMTEAGLVE